MLSFSNYFSRPAYQDAAVLEYFQTYDPGVPYYTDGQFRSGRGRYNRNGRAFPDLGASWSLLSQELVQLLAYMYR